MKKIFAVLILSLSLIQAQAQPFDRQDTLRGAIGPARVWWDLTYYHLDVKVDSEEKSIEGKVEIAYQVLEPSQGLQVDLQSPLKISKVLQDGKSLDFRSEGNAHFITLDKAQKPEAIESIFVYYSGHPKEAVRAPWDGGFSWKEDENGNPFVATSCQGLGASVWWPCKDHMYDEPDSMLISVEVAKGLVDVSNGRLRKIETNKKAKTKTYHWFVENPINNYGVNANVGKYTSWDDVFKGEKGDLDVSYWVIKGNEQKAKKQFTQVHKMLEAFEHWFGPYPFYEDGYKIVEVPYLGMEHQSSVTYGNGYQNGYLGRDLSGTGWGLKFDFLIIHESGHEWFANNITYKDMSDMWIHESFTNYSESLYLDYYFGKEAGQEYVRGVRKNIANQYPMIGPYDVNYEHPDSDIYYKGSNMLNMIRDMVSDDEKWRQILRGLNEEFYHQTVTTEQIESYIIQQSRLDLADLFNQYLRTAQIPIFEYYFQDGKLNYRFTNCIETFAMILDIEIGGERLRLMPRVDWQQLDTKAESLTVDPDYYVGVLKSR